MNIESSGFEIVGTGVIESKVNILRETLFHRDRAGERCLLDHPLVREAAIQLKQELIVSGHLAKNAVTIQAITFDKTESIPDQIATHGEVSCLAKSGEALLMQPLILHASSQATEPKHRRVLHFVYHGGEAIAETWHRAV